MYCKKCGTEQKQGQKFCPKCGTPFKAVTRHADDESSAYDEESACDEGPVFDEEPVYDDYPVSEESPTPSAGQSVTVEQKTVRNVLVAIGLIAVLAGLGYWGWNRLPDGKIADLFTSYEQASSVDGIPFKSTEKGKWGMLKPDGTVLFEEEFKDVPTLAHDGRFMVKNGNGLWEIFTAEEKPNKVGDEYVSLGDFYNGVAPAVRKNEQISLIDKDGNVIAVLDKSGAKPITRMENFHYGYALFEAGDAVGIVNTRGEILLEARKYCKIYHVAPKQFLALDMKYKDEEDRHNYVYDVIDPVGNRMNTIRMAKYNDIVVLDDGYIGIEQTSDGEKLYGIMDLDGKIIVRPTNKTRGLYGYNDGKFIFSDGEYWGIRTVEDEVLIRAKYDAILWASDEMIWATSVDDGRREMSLVDLEGNKLTRDTYQDALPFYDGRHAYVQITDKTWGIINNKGEELTDVPDICDIKANTADQVIVSDYVDLDAVVDAVNMTPNGFGGFGINMSALNLLKVYNEHCSPGDQKELNPSATHTDRLSYSQDVSKGINFNVELYYSGYISERGGSHYDNTIGEWIQEPDKWTTVPPQYIKMKVSGYKMSGKTNLLYKKLVSKMKTYGQIYKENDHACIIIWPKQKGMILVDNGSEVWGMVKSDETLLRENIEQYSESDTRTYYRPQEYVEEAVDSIADVY